MDDIAVLNARIESLMTLVDQKFIAADAALKVALASNDKRLDGMNEFRATLSDQTRQLISRTEATTAISALHDKIDVANKPNYVLAISVGSLLLATIAGVWMVIGLKIDSTTAPVLLTIQQLQSAKSADDVRYDALVANVRRLQQDSETVIATKDQAASDRTALASRLGVLEAATSAGLTELRGGLAASSAQITRLNVWLDFVQAKVFPEQPVPPTKQP